PVAVSAGDFNEDGKADVAVANNGAGPTTGTISVALGNGDGTLRAAAAYQVNRPGFGESPGAFAAADLNGDGRVDFATLLSGGAVEIMLSQPDSSLLRGAAYSVGNAADVAVGDVNQDGKLDLVVTGYTNLTVLLGDGDATFQPLPPQALPPPQSTTQNVNHRAALGDFNRDGKLDLVITNLTSAFSDVSIMLGNGDGTFQSPVNYF